MKISIVASTIDEQMLERLFEDENVSLESAKAKLNEIRKEGFDIFSGKAGGICYMPSSWDVLNAESKEKSLKRSLNTKENGHHSTQAHDHVSLVIEDCSKLFAMLLNNEHEYVTSEKSARYTKMALNEQTSELYNKWNAIYKDILDKNHPELNERRRTKLAMENARYLISVFNPSTTMMYTTSYRQLNYIYNWAKDLANNPPAEHADFYNKIVPELKEFCELIEKTDLVDKVLKDDKSRGFSLIASVPVVERFNTSYETEYLSTFAALAQAHRHRTIYYAFDFIDEEKYYVPKMIQGNKELEEEWLKDMKSVGADYPQGKLVKVSERGTKEMAVLKAKERICAMAQSEIADQTTELLLKYYDAIKDNGLSYYNDIRAFAEKGNACSRCVSLGYHCASPCGEKDGILNRRNY